jgi:hypothetical protein
LGGLGMTLGGWLGWSVGQVGDVFHHAAFSRLGRIADATWLPPPPDPTGQICSSTSRILVHSSVAAAFYEKLRHRAQAIKVGDPLQPGCRLGPLVNAAQYKRVTSYVQVRVGAMNARGGVSGLGGVGFA